jgi:hypothetical protein
MKITAQKISPYLRAIIALCLIGAILHIFFVLKEYFYTAISGSAIISANGNGKTTTVDVDEFNNLINNISAKTSASSTDAAVSPFR